MENIYFEIKSKRYLRIMLQHSITKINIAMDASGHMKDHIWINTVSIINL